MSVLIDDMGVANVGFLIENLGKDAGELQYLREVVQNAIESIERLGESPKGRVEIDFEEIDGVKKLRVTDNGIGMTPDDVRDNINRLSASAGTQAFDKNFGIETELYSGSPRFSVPVGVVGRSLTGIRKFQIGARYQVCSDRVCLPPRLDKLDVSIRISARA